jgi:hypothetical protein
MTATAQLSKKLESCGFPNDRFNSYWGVCLLNNSTDRSVFQANQSPPRLNRRVPISFRVFKFESATKSWCVLVSFMLLTPAPDIRFQQQFFFQRQGNIFPRLLGIMRFFLSRNVNLRPKRVCGQGFFYFNAFTCLGCTGDQKTAARDR